jgi:hypothetical protein
MRGGGGDKSADTMDEWDEEQGRNSIYIFPLSIATVPKFHCATAVVGEALKRRMCELSWYVTS